MEKINSYNNFINESNTEFQIDDMVLYNYKYIAQVIGLHPGYELLKVRIFHEGSLTTITTDISSTLCEKFN